jgi:hypothetical protein
MLRRRVVRFYPKLILRSGGSVVRGNYEKQIPSTATPVIEVRSAFAAVEGMTVLRIVCRLDTYHVRSRCEPRLRRMDRR